MQDDLLRSIEHCRVFLDGLAPLVAIIDVRGETRFVNRSWAGCLGEAGQGRLAWLDVVLPEERDHVGHVLDETLQRGTTADIEFTVHHSREGLRTLSCSVSPALGDGGAFAGLALICRDVTERRRREQRLSFMAGHDPLTGLANRRLFEEELSRAVSRVERGGRGVVLMIDLDHLKQYNDAKGHQAGDQALVNLALLLRTHVRASDLPARIGGDEFAVLLDDAAIGEALEVAERMGTAAREEEFVHGAREFGLGISGGLTEVEGGCDARSLMDRADVALYAAKEGGRDRMVVWDPSLGGLGSFERVGDVIRSALDGDGFALLFQPVVRLDNHEVSYYESLLRLRSPRGDWLKPVDFFPVAERLGFMGKITARVFDLAGRTLAENPGLSLSVNLSSSDIVDPATVTFIKTALSSGDLPCDRLVLELSEASVMSHLPVVQRLMDDLDHTGCRFALDDFGTALGSFALLRTLPVHQVKLARPVVRALAESEQALSFVRSVRELIESQDKVVVAAFVDSDELLGWVENAGFTYGQGFTLHEPVSDLGSLAARMERARTEQRLG